MSGGGGYGGSPAPYQQTAASYQNYPNHPGYPPPATNSVYQQPPSHAVDYPSQQYDTTATTTAPGSPYYDPYAACDVYGKQSAGPLKKSSSQASTVADVFDAENPIRDDAGDGKLTPDVSTEIRHGFVRKVYAILSLQLLYTFGFGLVFSLVPAARIWLMHYWWVTLIFMIVGLIVMITITCKPDLGRRFPTNYILLGLITICISWTIALAGAGTSSSAFAIAAGITAVVCIGLTIFAMQTKWDFTGCSVFIFVAILVLIIFGIIAMIVRSKIMNIVYASLGALLFSFVLVYDTQQVVGGKHRKYQYSLDDYVFGALTLYLDVVNLFLMILRLAP
eukprot:GHVS01012742.1.p1 GENE.GHVS01012742.1~~GHVS01012742.1.p1  ORF type:complete len:335 (-),score=37.10 GHVS01012742.1:648-1652(-)